MMIYAIFVAILSYLFIRLLGLTSHAEIPIVSYREGCAITENIIKQCTLFNEPFVPTLMFGKNGHLQTLLYGLLGRIHSVVPSERHETTTLKDGTPITFDIFISELTHNKKDVTMVVCPGIANTSESVYLRTFSKLAQHHGYRVAVLNHLGVLPDEKLTTPRIFSYGDTEEYSAMVNKIKKMFPETKLIAVGFSMGGNIITKYLGESPEHREGFICGISLCQGYDAERAMQSMSSWNSLSKGYYFVVGQRMKRILWNHRHVLFTKQEDLARLLMARYLWDIDEVYTKRQHNFDTIEELYRWCSCCHHIHNVDIPMLLVNAADDPLVGEELCKLGQSFANEQDNIVHVLTKHGGHLGFFEGGIVMPHSETWIDRAVVQFADAACTSTLKTQAF